MHLELSIGPAVVCLINILLLELSRLLELETFEIMTDDWVKLISSNCYISKMNCQSFPDLQFSSAELFICFYTLIYLLTAIGLTPGGSSTVHIYTQTIHRTTQLIWEECEPCPFFARYTLLFALQLRKNKEKSQSWSYVRMTARLVCGTIEL